MTKIIIKNIINKISKILVHVITLFAIFVFIYTALANNEIPNLLRILIKQRYLWLPIINFGFIITVILFILEIKKFIKSKNKKIKSLIIYGIELFIIYFFSFSVGFCYCAIR